MASLIAVILVFMAMALVAVMLFQGLSGKVELLSVRNFFLLGFIVFQLISGALGITGPQTRDFGLVGMPGTAILYFFMVTIFLGLFFLAYSRGWFVHWLAYRVPVGNAEPAAASMLTLAFVFLGVGLFFRVVLIQLPVVAPAFFMMGSGLLAVAAGTAAWVWAGRMFNPVIAIMTFGVTALALAGVLHTDFGRRAILGVVGCFGWGAYHGYWKHLGPRAVLVRLGGAGFAALVLIAAFTAARDSSNRDRSLGQSVSAVRGANVKEGIYLLLSGQDAGRNSMWLIENYPSRYPYDTLHTGRYFLTLGVPREFYENKPEALGRTAVAQANADRKRASNYSIGPGIIGHIASDNPLLALPIYAIFGGLLIGFLDRLIVLYPTNPFVVLPVGTTLGQFVGLARGETGLFLFQAVLGISAVWVLMYLCAKVMSMLGWRMQTADEEGGGWDHHAEHGSEVGPYDDDQYGDDLLYEDQAVATNYGSSAW